MNNKEIRWKQRFENYKRAFKLLEKALKIKKPSEVECGGIIQFYEMALELGWKTLKDYNEAQGLITKSPREAIKQAFQADVIKDGHTWIDALEDRNLTSHIYDEKTIINIISKIRMQYYQILKELFEELKNADN